MKTMITMFIPCCLVYLLQLIAIAPSYAQWGYPNELRHFGAVFEYDLADAVWKSNRNITVEGTGEAAITLGDAGDQRARLKAGSLSDYNAYLSALNMYGSVTIQSPIGKFCFENSTDGFAEGCAFRTSAAYNQWNHYTHPAFGNNFVFTDYDNRLKNHDLSETANPTLWLFYYGNVDSDNTRWMNMYHNGTNGHIGTGTGGVEFDAFIGLKPIAAPSNPASGGVVFIDSSDNDLKIKYSDGTVVTIGDKP